MMDDDDHHTGVNPKPRKPGARKPTGAGARGARPHRGPAGGKGGRDPNKGPAGARPKWAPGGKGESRKGPKGERQQKRNIKNPQT